MCFRLTDLNSLLQDSQESNGENVYLELEASWCVGHPHPQENLRPVFSAAQARRGRGSVLAGSAFHRRGRKEVGQVEEELDGQGLVGSDTFSDSDNDTMVAWVEEESE